MTIRICMWSGPRNLSSAMMRSFEARNDCAVLDEPFFAPYLAVTGVDHPGREETLAAHETDPNKAVKVCLQRPPNDEPLYFQKHMPHQMNDGFDRSWMHQCRHFFLLRDPAAVIASYAKGRTKFTTEDIGFLQQAQLYDEICGWADTPPPIISSEDILKNPEAMLRKLCVALDIQFDPAMLSWPKGRRATDGAWAPYWYKNVEASTGFGEPKETLPAVEPRYLEIYEKCSQAYLPLYTHRLRNK